MSRKNTIYSSISLNRIQNIEKEGGKKTFFTPILKEPNQYQSTSLEGSNALSYY